MYDFLDKIGLKTALEQIKAKFPSSLPANGGNADYATNAGNANKVGGKSADEFMPYIGYVDDLGAVNQNCICSWSSNTLNTPFIAGKTNAAAGICIVNNVNGLWPTYFVICAGIKQCFIHYQDSREFVGNWQEISTTPIKSTTFSGTTNDYGGLLWISASAGKVPLFVDVESKYVIPFRFVGNYWFYMTHATVANHAQPAANVAATGTVYYVEI